MDWRGLEEGFSDLILVLLSFETVVGGWWKKDNRGA